MIAAWCRPACLGHLFLALFVPQVVSAIVLLICASICYTYNYRLHALKYEIDGRWVNYDRWQFHYNFVQACKDLTLAAASGRTSDLVRAIELGAEIDLTVNGYTALMRAANWGHADTVAALVVEGADMFATDQRGRTALDWARIARRHKVAETLERAMENEIRYRR